MKIRTGFISNSSSSSFVVVGIEMELTKDVEENLYEDNSKFSLLSYYSENKAGVCVVVSSTSDDDYYDIELDLEEFKELEAELQKEFNTSTKAKVYVGRRYS